MELGYWIVRILQRYSSQKETGDTHPMTLAEIQKRAAAQYDGWKKPYEEYKAERIMTY